MGLAELSQFHLRDSRLVGGTIMEPRSPGNRPHQPHTTQYPKDSAPAEACLQRNKGEGCERCAQPARCPDDSLAARPLLPGKPTRNDAGGIGVGSGRTYSKEKAGDEELPESAAPAGKRSKDGPPRGDAGELGALPIAVTQCA